MDSGKLQPALLGGVFIGVLSALPIIPEDLFLEFEVTQSTVAEGRFRRAIRGSVAPRVVQRAPLQLLERALNVALPLEEQREVVARPHVLRVDGVLRLGPVRLAPVHGDLQGIGHCHGAALAAQPVGDGPGGVASR